MRQTRQRAAILRALDNTEQHPTAEWIFQQVREDLPHISLGTVYRLLHSLVEEGKIGALALDGGPSRYDGSPGPHHHVVCTSCGHATDVPELLAPEARSEIERWTGYAVSHLQLNWYGLCPACRAAGKLSETPAPPSEGGDRADS